MENNSKIHSINMENNSKIHSINMENNSKIHSINMENNSKIHSINMENNSKIHSINMENNSKIHSINMENNSKIHSINMENNSKIHSINMENNSKIQLHKLQTFINSRLNKILSIHWPEKIKNKDLWKTANQEPVSAQICRRKWGWMSHTLGKPASNITLQAVTWNPQRKRKSGRRRNTWRRNTEAEMLRSGLSWKELEKTAQSGVSDVVLSKAYAPQGAGAS